MRLIKKIAILLLFSGFNHLFCASNIMVDISIINDTKKNIKVTYAQEVLNLAPQQTKVVKMATKEQIIKIEVDRKKQKYKEQLILQGRPQLTASMNIYFDKACKLQVKSHNWVTLILKFYLTREH